MEQGQIIWFEIPVKDLDVAIKFYSAVLGIKIEKNRFLETEYGIFKKDSNSIGGALVHKENFIPSEGLSLFFYVVSISESLLNVTKLGGRIIVDKILLKQKTEEGYLTINNNLIDNKIGYHAEFLDCDGNKICLYSNS